MGNKIKQIKMINAAKIHNKVLIDYISLLVFCCLAPLSLTPWDRPNLVFLMGMMGLSFIVVTLTCRVFIIDKIVLPLVIGYTLFIFFGLIATFISIQHLPSEYFVTLLKGRLVTSFFCILVFLMVSRLMCESIKLNYENVFNVCVLICIIFLFFGLWQLISFKLGIYYPIETRTQVHGVGQDLKQIFGNRITSLAREPNFFSPLIFESLILFYFFVSGHKKYFLIISMLLVGVFTLSAGFFIHGVLLFSSIVAVNFFKLKFKLKLLAIFFFIFLILFIVGLLSESLIGEYLIKKVTTELSGASMRAKVILELFSIINEAQWYQLIIGFGLGTIEYSNSFWGAGQYVNFIFTITNITYLDVFFQAGLVGFISFISPYIFFCWIFWKKRKINKYYMAGLLFLLSFIISGLYRSEYAGTHFIWGWVITLCCFSLARKNEQYY